MLRNLQHVAKLSQWRALVDDLRGLPGVTLARFLDQTGREIADVYRRPDQSWTRLQRDAGVDVARTGRESDERDLLRALRRMLNIDDPERVGSIASCSRAAAHRSSLGSTSGSVGCC